MDAIEAQQRAAVVAEARTWIGTPYHHCARVKGVGVDCLTLIAEVFERAGVVQHVEIPPYSPQWHLHHGAERYLEGLLGYARAIEGPPLPGDVVLWRFGRCFSHGAIVTEWPVAVHAYVRCRVREEDALAASWLTTIGESSEDRGRPRPRRYFSVWGR